MDQVITHKTSLLAWKKGYRVNTKTTYEHDGKVGRKASYSILDYKGSLTSRPTQTEIAKWLREKYKIILTVNPILKGENFEILMYWGNGFYPSNLLSEETEDDSYFDVWEDCLEDLIMDGLNALPDYIETNF